MLETSKIDSFFNEGTQFKPDTQEVAHVSKWTRFVKLGFPCIAAALLGMMIVLPNIKKSVDLRDSITMPRKNELEKLHIEETVFSAVDSKNRVNTVTADSVDEVEPGSQKVKFNNPKGIIPTENGLIEITADTGYFTQNDNILELEQNVKTVIEEKTIVTTEHAVYDFNKEFGYGKKEVKAVGDWGTLTAPEFTYDRKEEILTLIGASAIKTAKGTLTADDKTEIYQRENKTISEGNAVLKHEDKSVRADKIIAYFTNTAHKDLKKVEVYGNVLVTTPKGTARGNRGIYNPQTQKVELFDNVRIEQNGNFISGEQAETDLKTSVSRLKGGQKTGGRISGIFYNKRKNKNGSDTKK